MNRINRQNTAPTPLPEVENPINRRKLITNVINTIGWCAMSISSMQFHRRLCDCDYQGFLKPLYDRVTALDDPNDDPWIPQLIMSIGLYSFSIALCRQGTDILARQKAHQD